MVHTRETRAAASEIKFLIAPALAPALREWTRARLDADPHGSGPFGDEYETSSLYFDTADSDVLNRRDSFARAKYRVRRYGAGEVVFLERKLRRPGLLIKRRTVVPLSTLDRLTEGPLGAWGGDWFHQRLQVRALRPVCQVSYHRTARAAETADGPARLTIDCDLRSVPVREPRFSAGAGTPFLQDRVIVELKFRVRMPAIFRRLVEEFALEPASASKYRLGMIALGHRPVDASPAVQTGIEASYA